MRRHRDRTNQPGRAFVDRDVPRQGKEKDRRIMLGLALLERHAHFGQPISESEIAAWCGCTDQAINNTIRKALSKLSKHPLARRLIAELN